MKNKKHDLEERMVMAFNVIRARQMIETKKGIQTKMTTIHTQQKEEEQRLADKYFFYEVERVDFWRIPCQVSLDACNYSTT